MLASIIIPAFNVEPWLAQCLDSVVSQSHSELDIVVIDDGSTDSTAEIIGNYARSDSRIRFVAQENRGLSAVRNRGMDLAAGDVLLFLDSDDWLHPDTVLDIVGLFERHRPDLVIYQCAKYYDDTGTWSSGTDDYYWRSINQGISAPVLAGKVPQMLTLYPLAQLKVLSRPYATGQRLQFIEGLKYEDNPFHARLFGQNPRLMFLPRRRYAWRQGRPGQITAKPHIRDCTRVIDEMTRSGATYDTAALPYLLIAMTRLAVNVAMPIADGAQRRSFLRSVQAQFDSGFEAGRLAESLATIADPAIAHPADRILVPSLLQMPERLADAIGSGLARYAAAGRCLLGSIDPAGANAGFRGLAALVRQWRELYHFSKGVGESRAEAF